MNKKESSRDSDEPGHRRELVDHFPSGWKLKYYAKLGTKQKTTKEKVYHSLLGMFCLLMGFAMLALALKDKAKAVYFIFSLVLIFVGIKIIWINIRR